VGVGGRVRAGGQGIRDEADRNAAETARATREAKEKLGSIGEKIGSLLSVFEKLGVVP
jgi:hypothetical protein